MKVVIYTQNNCQFTPQEKNYLASKGVTFEERNVETNKGYLDEMMKLGSNFAGTPVTQIVKDDGSSTVLKGFTQTEFDAALGGSPVAAANADMTMPQAPVDQPVAPVASDAMPPAPEPTPAQMPEPAPAPMPEPAPAPVVETPTPVEPSTDANALADKAVQTANADMTMPQAPVDQPVMPPMPEPTPTPAPEPTPAPMSEPAPAPMPEPTPAPVVETPAPVEPEVQTANADMTMPQAPVDQLVAPVASDAMPAAPEPTTPPTPEATADKAVQTANNPLDAILADLQQKVSATTPTVQSANADMTMPAAPVDQPVTPPTPEPAPVPSPEPTPVPAVDMPTPATSDVGPSADLPNVPDFPAK